jgi:predicted peptidase
LPEKLPSSPGYFALDATVTAGDTKFPMTFGMFLPANYFSRKTESFPIVITLHNDGIQGNGGNGLVYEGLGYLWVNDNWDPRDAEKRANLPELTLRRTAMFIGLAPQCPRGYAYDQFPVPQAIAELATQISKAYRADRSRTYLTGFSFGGTFCWRIAAALPDQFAAIAPISARNTPDPAQTVQKLEGMPVYLACGTVEWAYPCCQTMNNALEQARQDHIFKVIDGGTHWCYPSVYNDPEFWRWLFSKRSGAAGHSAATRPSSTGKP